MLRLLPCRVRKLPRAGVELADWRLLQVRGSEPSSRGNGGFFASGGD